MLAKKASRHMEVIKSSDSIIHFLPLCTSLIIYYEEVKKSVTKNFT